MNTSNWLDDNKTIMVGGKPYNDSDLQFLQKHNVSVFVNLTSNMELKSRHNFKYHLELPDNVQFIHFPIKDMSIECDNSTLELVDKIIKLSETNTIYIHCKGGHGRTGVIAGLIVHKLFPHLTYTQVLKYIQDKHRTRKVKPNMSSPQTASQFNQLHRIINKSSDVFFYNKQSPTYVFSNFYTQKKNKPLFTDDQNKTWFSSEAYYQAHKFIDTSPEGNAYAEIIRKTTSPHFAYLLGNMGGNIRPNWKIDGVPIRTIIHSYKQNVSIRKDWNNIKEDVMRQALLYKFGQNDDLKKILCSNTYHLVEYTPHDMYWGTFWNKNGQNRLGKMLETLRNSKKLI